MKRQTRRARRRSVSKTEANTAWFAYVNTGTLKNLALIAAAFGAVFWLNSNVFRPVYDSGPLPVPSRAEVDKLRVETTELLDGLNKSVANTLEVAKAARTEAQQAVQVGNDNRLTRLSQQKLQLEATLRMMPGDPVFTDLLARTMQEIARLSTAPLSQVPTTTPASAAESK